ncbi:helix-turn-helix domain-containing protein [Paremcibacter congregatus]|uniref:helix-turn-helix domain-containing protein n=1 Tax=Paremcibacter congregatus TaxID=2043170 RepID=UPI003A94CDAB
MAQEITLPDEKEKELAGVGSRMFAKYIDEKDVSLRVVSESNGETITIPQKTLRHIIDLLTEISKGNAVTLMPVHMELTTQEAANILHCSRPHLIKLLNQGKIAYEKVGTHRRIRCQDLLDYKSRRKQVEQEAARELTALSQELDLDQY